MGYNRSGTRRKQRLRRRRQEADRLARKADNAAAGTPAEKTKTKEVVAQK